MKCSISYAFLLLAALVSTTFATTINAKAEPMSFEEKEALIGGGAHRLLRELQSALTYKGQICRAETKGIMSCRTANSSCSPNQWDYWEIDRVTCILDPALTLMEGVGTTVPSGCFDFAGSSELTFIAAADDNDPRPDGCSVLSPFEDPKITVTPSASGLFTLAVVNFSSDTATCTSAAGFQYKIKISPRPLCV